MISIHEARFRSEHFTAQVAQSLKFVILPSKNMAIDWTKNYKRYKGLWVALRDDEKTVAGSGRSIQKALREARQKGCENPIVMRVPTEIVPYVGSFRV